MSPQAITMQRLLETHKTVNITVAREHGVAGPVSAISELLAAGIKIHADFKNGGVVWAKQKPPLTREQQEELEARAHHGISRNAAQTKNGRKIWRIAGDGSWWTMEAMAERAAISYDLVRVTIQRFRTSRPVRYTVNTRAVEGDHHLRREYQILRKGEDE